MSGLAGFRFEHPEDVDTILSDVASREPWAAVCVSGDSDGVSGDSDGNDPRARVLVSLVLWLAFRGQTDFASQAARSWSDAPTKSEASRFALHEVRGWLALSVPDFDVRGRAFHFAAASARALADLVDEKNSEEQIRGAFRGADALVHAVYFSSGAYGEGDELPSRPPAGYTPEALPVLDALAELRHPAIVYYLVETAGHLASIDPKGSFQVVHKAVRPDEPFAHDSLAADVTVSLIERYLADYRELVVSDQELLSQIRAVLNAFAKAGWSAAVSLSYRLGAVFR
ncbi:hypothetical protein [Isoptericola sp. NPDC058082]|uniref:hypothetical protein n=1 Tax=Isoptericola sp. NPDC058082 TaxID=3346331 RepID=UPI0036EA279D